MRPPLVRLLAVCLMTAAGLAAGSVPALADVLAKPARTWGTNGRVSVIVPLGDRVLVGGSFTAVTDTGGTSYRAANIAVFSPSTGRFITGAGWQGSTDGSVNAAAVSSDGSTIYVGGTFGTVDGAPRTRLAALHATDGTLLPWAPGVNDTVDNLATAGSSVYAVGRFTAVTTGASTVNRPYVAKLDGLTGEVLTGFAPAPNDRVRAVAISVDGSHIFLGGPFTSVSGKPRTNKVASVFAATGAVDPAFAMGANNYYSGKAVYAEVFDLAVSAGALLQAVGGAGGACTNVNAGTGALVWSKHSNGNMQNVRVLGDTAYCGGHYGGTAAFDGQTRYKLAGVTLATGTVTAFAPNINSALGVWALGADAADLYVGGDFDRVSALAQPHFAVFPTAQSAPLAPTLAADPGDGSVHLSWQPPDFDGGLTVSSYNIFRQVGAGVWKKIAGVRTTWYDNTGLTNGTDYSYYVQAVNGAGTGPASATLTVTPAVVAPTVPDPPSGVSAVSGAGVVQLSWGPPGSSGHSALTGYQVWRSTTSGAQSLLATVAPSLLAYDDRAISAGVTYYYELVATNSVGASQPSSELSATPEAGVPDRPTGLTAGWTGSTVHLSWTVPASDGGSPITTYRLIRDDVQVPANIRTTSYDDTAAASGTHTYQVVAVNAVGRSALSAPTTVKVP